MALLFADGFEHYGLGLAGPNNLTEGVYAQQYVTLYADGSQYVPARSGNRFMALNSNSTNICLRLVIPNATHNEGGIGFGLFLGELPTTTRLGMGFHDVCSLDVNTTGAIIVRQGSRWNDPILGISENILTAGAWNHVEMRVLRDSVVGEVEVRVNGITVLFLTGLDLGNGPLLQMSTRGGGAGRAGTFIDDLIIWDATGDVNNTFFGPARVTMLGLTGDEPGNQWLVEGAATGAAALTETTPDRDASYISAAITGQKSQFSLEMLPPEAEGIAGIYVPAMGKIASAGTGNTQVSIVSGEAEEKGPDNPMTTAYTYRGQVFEKDPNTGNLWTRTGLGNAKIKVEKTA